MLLRPCRSKHLGTPTLKHSETHHPSKAQHSAICTTFIHPWKIPHPQRRKQGSSAIDRSKAYAFKAIWAKT
eukprot:1161160-Pelagomonas_calceolata.AAC.2